MTTSLSKEDRAALALAAVEGLSDEALQKLVKEGGHQAKLAKAQEGVRQVYGTVLKLGEGVDTLGALAMLARAYMDERVAAHERKQQRLPQGLRQPITAVELYPEGFSMDKAKEAFKAIQAEPQDTLSSPRRSRRP